MIFAEDPRRAALSNEVHARPFFPVSAPLQVSHIAVLWDGRDSSRDHAVLASLCRREGVPEAPPGATHFAVDMARYALKWERHTEFSTFTFIRPGPFDDPFGEPAISLVPQDWLASLPGKIIVATHFALLPSSAPTPDAAALARIMAPESSAGSLVAGGAALAWTDFRIHADGFGRILVRDISMGPYQAGRIMQRLLEIETYRTLALLALPVAREYAGPIDAIGVNLAGLMQGLSEASGLDGERSMLDRLILLAADAERIAAATTFRFGAGRAYYALVRRRIEELREERIQGLQTIGEFLDRRLAPGMMTCESVGERLEATSDRLSRAAALLRTRIEVALEAQNRDLLASMNSRARMQVRLQRTVEGLSAVAMSYYLIGLMAYGVKGLRYGGWEVNPDVVVGIAVLPVAAGAWLVLRRLRGIIERDEGE